MFFLYFKYENIVTSTSNTDVEFKMQHYLQLNIVTFEVCNY